VGLPLHVIGLLLVLPFFVQLMERCGSPLVSAVLGLDPHLLRRRISTHFARTAGMVITLGIGLGAFASIHIWGGSMMAPFIPSHEFPDAIVSLLPNGVTRDAAQKVSALEGVAGGRCLTLEAEQFYIADSLTAQVVRTSGRMPASPNVLLMGADPQIALGGAHPLAPFRFVEGERQHAADALEGQTIPVELMTLEDLEASPIDWSQFSLDKPDQLRKLPKKARRLVSLKIRMHALRERQAVVECALDALTNNQRRVVEMIYYQRMRKTEIAKSMGERSIYVVVYNTDQITDPADGSIQVPVGSEEGAEDGDVVRDKIQSGEYTAKLFITFG
jgi:hypothetical protein